MICLLIPVDLLGLLKWRSNTSLLQQNLCQLMKVDGGEVVKVRPSCNSLFPFIFFFLFWCLFPLILCIFSRIGKYSYSWHYKKCSHKPISIRPASDSILEAISLLFSLPVRLSFYNFFMSPGGDAVSSTKPCL